jgi:hypothetical protein
MQIMRIFISAILSIGLSASAESFFVKNNSSPFQIVVSDQAIPAEMTAAKEFQFAIKEIFGAELKVIKANEYQSGPMVAVGFNSKLPDSLKAEKYGPLGEEELIIDSDGKNLLLAGGRPRGTLYAVYEYLDQLGVRWYTPDYTKYPKMKDIPLPEKMFRYQPPLKLRSYLQNNRPTPQWTARNRMNQFIVWGAPGEEFGGGFSQGPDMHTCWRMLSADLMTAHPKWCAEVNGKRELPAGTNYWGICFSNKEVCNLLIEKTLDYARKNPAIKVIWIGQNDGSPVCTCKECKSFTEAHGGKPSALVVRLVNELADRMAKEMPDRMVKTLAYAWSQDPPEGLKLRDNVIVMFCALNDYYKPIATDIKAKTIRDRAEEWRAIAKNIEVYLYEFPIGCYWFPTPNLYVTASNIEWAYQAGITNVYAQICGCLTGDGAELVDLRAWVYAKKFWNPNLNTQKLVEEFCRDYYGPAADVVLKAIALTNTNIFDKDGKMLVLNRCAIDGTSYLDPKVIRQINRMIEKTHDSLNDEVYKKRLRYVWIPYLWADVWLGFTGPGKYNAKNETWSVPMADGEIRSRYGALCKQFMLEAGVSALKENRRLNPNTLMMDLMGVPFKACRLKDGSVEAVAVPELAGHIFEFIDAKLNFSPLKPYNEHLVWEYPLHGPWRDYVNDAYIPRYEIKDRSKDQVCFEARQGDFVCRKTISLHEGTLRSVFTVEALSPSTAKIYPSPMLNMDRDVLGDYPTAWVEKNDGTWTKTVLGKGVSMFYYVGTLDIKDATGRIVLSSETRTEGIEITFDPREVELFNFEYDRNFHMVQLWPTSPNKNLSTGEYITVGLSMKIIRDAAQLTKRLSEKHIHLTHDELPLGR